MIEVRQTDAFAAWLAGLRDRATRATIAERLGRVAAGNLGDVKSVGGKVSELRINYGPGFRVYFTRKGAAVVILLCGGDKATQARDIKAAQALAREIHK
jgi:putative addiction module killer protein